MTEKFFLKIDAESPDGEAVKCETQIKVACSTTMATTVLASLLKQDENLRRLVTQAMLLVMSNEELSERISNDDFEKRCKNESEDLEF